MQNDSKRQIECQSAVDKSTTPLLSWLATTKPCPPGLAATGRGGRAVLELNSAFAAKLKVGPRALHRDARVNVGVDPAQPSLGTRSGSEYSAPCCGRVEFKVDRWACMRYPRWRLTMVSKELSPLKFLHLARQTKLLSADDKSDGNGPCRSSQIPLTTRANETCW